MKLSFGTGSLLGGLLGMSLGALATFGLMVGFTDDAPHTVVMGGTTEGVCDPLVDEDPGSSAPSKQERLSTCEDALARLRAAYNRAGHADDDQAGMVEALEELLVKSGGASPEGTPMDFPDWLPAHQTPQGFNAAIAAIQRDCPGVLPENATADCEEFPCMIAGESTKMPSWDAYRQCSTWSKYFGEGPGLRMHRVSAPGEEATFEITMQPVARDDEDQLREHMSEYQGNLDKRSEARREEHRLERLVAHNQASCEDERNGGACFSLGTALQESDPDKAREYLDIGCESGHGNSCNNLAWHRCHDNGQCDEEALQFAEQAAELRPSDGRGALDTLAYVLCQQGKRAEANDAYRRSCDAGYTQNCNKNCG